MAAKSADQNEAKSKGARKKDLDLKWAELTIRVNDLKKGRDVVTVTYPTDANSSLIVCLNELELYNRRLPGAIELKKSKHVVTSGEKGKIVIKLRKVQPGRWLERWSPRRDLPGPIGGDLIEQPCVTSSVSTLSSLPLSVEDCDEVTTSAVASLSVSSGPIITFPDSDDDNNRAC